MMHQLPYILTYKSQNLPQNLDLKVRGDLYAGHKIKNFFQPPKYAVSNVPCCAVTQLTVEAARRLTVRQRPIM